MAFTSKSQHKQVPLYLLSLVILTLSCFMKQEVLTVKDTLITSQDIKVKFKIEKAYSSNYSDTLGVIFKLIQQQWREKISEDIGIKITDEMLEKEAKRIEDNTKAPETLKKIKKLFKKNKGEYINQFVKDVLIARLLENKFHFDTTFQEEPLTKIRDVSEKIRTGEKVNSSVKVFSPNKEEIKKYYSKYANKKISEDKFSYFIVEGSRESLKVYLVEKNDYTEWFKKKALYYPITFHDKELKVKMLQRTKESKFWQRVLK